MNERQWVESVRSEVEPLLASDRIAVATGHRLPYTLHVARYRSTSGELIATDPETQNDKYQTDLLIAEQFEGAWVPRVIVECKLGRVSTHDALTYSSKAATHKNVHPYLRYGFLIGDFDKKLPGRLIWHGHHFDFMITLKSEKLTKKDRDRLAELLRDEVEASRTINKLWLEKSDFRLLHRKLVVEPRR